MSTKRKNVIRVATLLLFAAFCNTATAIKFRVPRLKPLSVGFLTNYTTEVLLVPQLYNALMRLENGQNFVTYEEFLTKAQQDTPTRIFGPWYKTYKFFKDAVDDKASNSKIYLDQLHAEALASFLALWKEGPKYALQTAGIAAEAYYGKSWYDDPDQAPAAAKEWSKSILDWEGGLALCSFILGVMKESKKSGLACWPKITIPTLIGIATGVFGAQIEEVLKQQITRTKEDGRVKAFFKVWVPAAAIRFGTQFGAQFLIKQILPTKIFKALSEDVIANRIFSAAAGITRSCIDTDSAPTTTVPEKRRSARINALDLAGNQPKTGNLNNSMLPHHPNGV